MKIQSKQEIDFKRLLKKCEEMAEKEINENNWRLEKFIESLDERLKELKALNVCQIDENDFANYRKKVIFLKGLIEAQMMVSSTDRLMATEILSPISVNPINSLKSDKTKEIHLNIQSKVANDVRNELFFDDKKDNSENNLRKRDVKQVNTSDDFDAVLKYHNSMQERVAEEMIELAHNLKLNCNLSNEIIKKDTEMLEKTAVLAEGNTDNLKQNTSKIGEYVRRSCQYWLWIMLFIVSFTFLWIVVFIRMFPKRYYTSS